MTPGVCDQKSGTNDNVRVYEFMKYSGAFTVVFRPNPCVFRVRACGAARQDEEKFRDRAREWRCIMKTTRSLELTLALLPSPPPPPARASLL